MSSSHVDLCDIKRTGHDFEGAGEARFERSSFYIHGLASKDAILRSHTWFARSQHLDGRLAWCCGKFGSEGHHGPFHDLAKDVRLGRPRQLEQHEAR
jgi:hypothetical protein